MKDFLSKYKTETIASAVILAVMFLPYFIMNSGLIKSEKVLLGIDTITKIGTPIIIGGLCAFIVYRAIKKNREED